MLWVDLLTRREFEAGFGSHTPIFSGQTRCVRYHMNFERGLALFKEVLLEARRRPRGPCLRPGARRRGCSAAAARGTPVWQRRMLRAPCTLLPRHGRVAAAVRLLRAGDAPVSRSSRAQMSNAPPLLRIRIVWVFCPEP